MINLNDEEIFLISAGRLNDEKSYEDYDGNLYRSPYECFGICVLSMHREIDDGSISYCMKKCLKY